jgi:hypothetical protein
MAKSSGKYFADVMQGNVFHGVTAAAGTTFPLSTGTAMTFGLWNVTPNKNGVLLGLNAGFTSGTLALGEVGLTAIYGGYALATANNITAFTNGVLGTTIFNAQIGYGQAPAMRFTPSAATVVANVASYWTGLSAITASTVSTINWNHDFDGKVIVPPGWAVFVTGSIAQTALFSMCLTWAEVPQ